MKRSFVEVADSPYQLKKMIEESLKIKAAGILSNPDFQQAAALGLLEFQDNDDQLTPNLTPDELLKFFSQVVSYHDNEHPQGTLKRISSKTDTHSEEPNEDLESAYKKLFGTSIDKDPAFKHFFESDDFRDANSKIKVGVGYAIKRPNGNLALSSSGTPLWHSRKEDADRVNRANHGGEGTVVKVKLTRDPAAHNGRLATEDGALQESKINKILKDRGFSDTAIKNAKADRGLTPMPDAPNQKSAMQMKKGMVPTQGRGYTRPDGGRAMTMNDTMALLRRKKEKEAGATRMGARPLKKLSNAEKSLSIESIEENYKNFIAEYEAVLEENGIYEYDLDEATEFFLGKLEEADGSSLVNPTDGSSLVNPTRKYYYVHVTGKSGNKIKESHFDNFSVDGVKKKGISTTPTNRGTSVGLYASSEKEALGMISSHMRNRHNMEMGSDYGAKVGSLADHLAEAFIDIKTGKRIGPGDRKPPERIVQTGSNNKGKETAPQRENPFLGKRTPIGAKNNATR